MKVIADRMVFVKGSRVAAGQVFELPDTARLSKCMTRVDDDVPTGDPGTPNVSRRRGRKAAEAPAEPDTMGALARAEAAALAIPDPEGQPSP
ncbi:MAG: hypothetical protein KA200_00110 [Burkholderiales bacterium]|nr:hypothetical protein [Burkholderiales bacterium]